MQFLSIKIKREATTQEKCLSADIYADVISSLFSLSKNEGSFCFGLFGHWGRGKTYLINLVSKKLRDNRYQSIFFSAWKYPTKPEIWAYLYEQVLRAAKQTTWFLSFRASIVRYGSWPVIGAIFSFFLLLLSIGEKLNIISHLLNLLGLGGLIYLLYLYVRVKTITLRLQKRYTTIARHNEKLGLQATIGNDLKALLIGWLPGNYFHDTWKSFPIIFCYSFSCLLVSWQLWPTTIIEKFNIYIPIANLTLLSIRGTVAWLPFLLWISISIILPLFILYSKNKIERGLLIIDDLDRCDPSQMLDIIESVLLLLDDVEISNRLQVAMLVDEFSLNYSILKKYSVLIHSENSFGVENNIIPEQIVCENIEKFFTVYLRLPYIEDSQCH